MANETDESLGADPNPATSEGGYVAPTGPSKASEAAIEAAVKALFKEYDEAYKFDEPARRQYAVDRRYAAGTADMTWAVSANLIGSFIDILCSTLYARDPDVSCRKAQQVEESGTAQMEAFARTVELVVSRLWKDGRIKKTARKVVRSILSTGPGWFKGILITDKVPQPEVEAALNDLRETSDRLAAAKFAADDPDAQLSPEELDVKKAEIAQLEETEAAKIEKSVRKFMAIDFIPSQQMQVSLDVNCTEDYLDANWCANYIFVPTADLKVMFPALTTEQIKTAKQYYLRKSRENDRADQDLLTPIGQITADSSESYSISSGGEQTESFAKVIELWDRRDTHIKTLVEGVKVWAKPPYTPPYATSRFYPYFRTAFYEIDDTRHPQSLAYRLAKLQDEYACSRSNQRLTRERSIPGVLFNATQLSDEEAGKVTSGKQQELIGIKSLQPDTPMANLFAAKPIGQYDPRLYDTTMILADMDRMSGVQQAMQQAAASAQPKTATEASIEQAGASSRTGTDRDLLETTLSDFAQYTAECAMQALTQQEVQRICGAHSFWPVGIAVEDLLTLVEVKIEAGTTGKPRNAGDMNAWVQALPLIKETLMHTQQALAQGNQPLYDSLVALLRETLTRLGDTTDVDSFIPKQPPPKPTGPPPPQVKVSLTGMLSPEAALQLSGMGPPPGAAGPGAIPPAPAEGGGGGGLDVSHNPSLTHNPALDLTHAPQHHVDNSVHLHIKSGEPT